ncbi:hypothetical protein F4780DRAFT_773192 [Xylariomycetidae sp. FL0641]|nr:hypothetical protein F4780DRAFT_773192 [Xylariomycetidae sp. FL0641]
MATALCFTLLASAAHALSAVNASAANAPLVTDDISSCGDVWMAVNDTIIGNGTDSRTGFQTAVDKFCTLVDRATVEGQGYLSMATEVYISGGQDPSTYGLLGFVYFEIHNKQSSTHTPDAASCKTYLGKLAAAGGACSGNEYNDTRGGSYQVGTSAISYHGLASAIPPQQDALNKLYTSGALAVQHVDYDAGPPLDPWPLSSLAGVRPAPCHSHNDYTRTIPLFSALAAGCVGVEADVWLVLGDLWIGHLLPLPGRTLAAQYIEPLKAILDHNGGGSGSVYAAAPAQTLALLVDFKTGGAGTLDAVSAALEPLRRAGYLSRVGADGEFVRGAVTVVASGSAPFDLIAAATGGAADRDIFFDAPVDDLGAAAADYNASNSYYASADFQDAVGDPASAQLSAEEVAAVSEQVAAAHERGLKVRYWNLPGDYVWEPLAALGVDLLNADDMSATARLERIPQS